MKVLNIMTENAGHFKLLIEVLKEILVETNIEFRGDTGKSAENDSYMKIQALDPTTTVYIYLKLNGKNFSTFDCKTKDNAPLVIGVNLSCFHRLIKTMDKDECLTLFMERENMNNLNIKMESSKFKKITTYDLKLLDLGTGNLKPPSMKFDSIILINSGEFHKLCKEMSIIADLVEIKCYQKEVVFSCKGDYASRKTSFKSSSPEEVNKDVDSVGIKFSDDYKENIKIVQGTYELKHLALFAKCSQLCDNIRIYMKNNRPMIINYTIASFGKVYLCLSPVNEDSLDKKEEVSDKNEGQSDNESDIKYYNTGNYKLRA